MGGGLQQVEFDLFEVDFGLFVLELRQLKTVLGLLVLQQGDESLVEKFPGGDQFLPVRLQAGSPLFQLQQALLELQLAELLLLGQRILRRPDPAGPQKAAREKDVVDEFSHGCAHSK